MVCEDRCILVTATAGTSETSAHIL